MDEALLIRVVLLSETVETFRIMSEDDLSAKPRVGNSLIAFIDLLGFSQEVEHACQDTESFTEIIRKVVSAQLHFDHTLGPRDPLDAEDCTVLAFSDCIIWNCPLKTEATPHIGEYDETMYRLRRLGDSQLNCVLEGTFVRGAVDFGLSYHYKTVFVSDGLVRAHRAESGYTTMPVISLTARTSALVWSQQSSKSGEVDFDHVIFEGSFDYDGDSYPLRFINYLYVWWGDEAAQVQTLEKHREVVLAALKRIEKPRVRSKYQWLIGYHNLFVKQYLPDRTDLLATES